MFQVKERLGIVLPVLSPGIFVPNNLLICHFVGKTKGYLGRTTWIQFCCQFGALYGFAS